MRYLLSNSALSVGPGGFGGFLSKLCVYSHDVATSYPAPDVLSKTGNLILNEFACCSCHKNKVCK